MPNLNFEIANAVYVHVPFCSSKCPYCDFYSAEYTKKRVGQYWTALFAELEEMAENVNNNLVQTIYIGGGTPSLISPNKIAALIKKIKSKFKVIPGAEITMEVNPASINEKKIIALRRAGINRLSVGIQSFNDDYLSFLGRESSKNRNKKVLKMINKYFDNYSADLIFALPGQKIKEFSSDLEELLKFSPPHISLYNLEIHEETPFYQRYKNGRLNLVPEEVDAEMYDLAVTKLKENNYLHYEISNFAKKSFRTRHNYIYWLYQPYLGLGPGAAGFDGKNRYQNNRNLEKYINYYNPQIVPFLDIDDSLTADNKRKNNNIIRNSSEKIRKINKLTQKEKMAEYTFLALRTSQGLFFHKFYKYFNKNFKKIYNAKINSLKKKELIKETNNRIFLTEEGKRLANEVFLKFLLD